jgi:thiol-disulfide isomerase/thioredoxin
MQNLSNITWYYIIIACLVIVILFLLYSNYQCATKSCSISVQRNEKFEDEKKNQGEIVLYYASWCPHCKNFMPEWDKFENYAKDKFQSLKVNKMQCENGNEAICKEKGVQGYPTIIFYDQTGKANMYDGDRTMEGLLGYITNKV